MGFVLPAIHKPSGWRTYALGLIRALAQQIEPVLIVPAEEARAAQEAFPQLPLFPLPATQSASLQSVRGALRLWQTLRSVRALKLALDVVHSLEAYPSGLVGHWLARQCGCPHVITVHGTYGVIWAASFFDRILYRQVLRAAAHLCPVSQATAQRMRQVVGDVLRGVPLTPVLNGNDFYQRVAPEIALERRLPEIPTLISVGEVKPRKGYHISLQVFAQLQKEIPAARYEIVGFCADNPYTRTLREMIERHGLTGVTFHGEVSRAKLGRLYQQASLFILTPQDGSGSNRFAFEGFGLVYLEAGAYGLPVIATDCGGVAEAVRDGETGFVLPQSDIEGIAAAAYRLLTDEELNLSLGRANRRWAETLTWTRTAEQILAIYRRVVGER
ncbi:MAG: glycosyltransferase family 4 protein [Anaerolineales bacterium]|nr:glycosyltransferase family 4 protein [Anaerolineales bacterium]MDW8162627.1 glycosyltransferase family 4 protein [Anaerolineales bacterium]